MPASIVRPTWTYAIAVTLAVIALAACGASDTPQESTPTIDTLTPEAPTTPGIGVDRQRARPPWCSSWTRWTSRSTTALTCPASARA